MKVERLEPGSGERLRAIRLRALADSPEAFGTTLGEAASESVAEWERQVREIATFVAAVDGCDVGLVRGERHDRAIDCGYLISMWVAPMARRQGVAAGLIDAVVRWARDEGLSRLVLDVAEKNLPALALYTRKGFVPNGNRGSLPPPREESREIQLELWL